uniref:Uncharacterized protein n=1 Tax=Fagus sylvatica TaxID=28930 RepID=A0A2N9EQ49_FAGSY
MPLSLPLTHNFHSLSALLCYPKFLTHFSDSLSLARAATSGFDVGIDCGDGVEGGFIDGLGLMMGLFAGGEIDGIGWRSLTGVVCFELLGFSFASQLWVVGCCGFSFGSPVWVCCEVLGSSGCIRSSYYGGF